MKKYQYRANLGLAFLLFFIPFFQELNLAHGNKVSPAQRYLQSVKAAQTQKTARVNQAKKQEMNRVQESVSHRTEEDKIRAQRAASVGVGVAQKGLLPKTPSKVNVVDQKKNLSREELRKSIDESPIDRQRAEQAVAGGLAATKVRMRGGSMAEQKAASDQEKQRVSLRQEKNHQRIEEARARGGDAAAADERSKIHQERRQEVSEAYRRAIGSRPSQGGARAVGSP